MWTMEELMELKTPFLTMQDITKKDWEHLDFELEKYDIAKEEYDLDGCKVLAFVLQQIHYNKMNFNEVPNFIRNGRQFQEFEDGEYCEQWSVGFEGDSFEGYYYHKMRENDNYVKYTYFC